MWLNNPSPEQRQTLARLLKVRSKTVKTIQARTLLLHTLLAALVLAGTPLAQSLRIARTLHNDGENAGTSSVRLLMPGEWEAPQFARGAETGKTAPANGQTRTIAIYQPVSDQWDSAPHVALAIGDLPLRAHSVFQRVAHATIHRECISFLPQTDPPAHRGRGPPIA
jgi:hypothetical protein